MTPDELEAAYDQSKWARNMPDILARFPVLSEIARSKVGEPRRLSYGPSPDEVLDFYQASAQPAPVVVFVHGGGWMSGFGKDHAFPVEMVLAAGMHFITLDFSTVKDAGGHVGVLVDQVRRAIIWLGQNAADLNIDADSLYIIGHSSGAHLSAMTLSTRWTDYGVAKCPIRGGMIISGIYDLEPLRHTSRSKNVRIDDDVVRDFSPVHQIPLLTAPVLLAVGSGESPEFLRQTLAYAAALRDAGRDVEVLNGETYNHFDILETLGNPYGLLGRSLLNFIARRA